MSSDEPKADSGLVKILSMREGDIILAGGAKVVHGSTADVSREVAESLVAQFPAHVRIID